jgi:hypothetical protein
MLDPDAMTQLNPDLETLLSVIYNIPAKKAKKIESFANKYASIDFPGSLSRYPTELAPVQKVR